MRLFHYTDLNALYSMLTNRKLRLTDIRYLNDSRELYEGIDFIRNELQTIDRAKFENEMYFRKAIDFLDCALKDFAVSAVSEDPLFVFSLSNQPDCLSQWRAYGKYAIEFDKEFLLEDVKVIKECVYVGTGMRETVYDKVMNAVSDVSVDMSENLGCLNKSHEILNDLIHFATTLKHGGFSEECESRIIFPASESDFQNNIQYRARGDILVPYIEVPISLDCIKSITVGPVKDQDLAFNSMYDFIKKIERVHQVNIGNIEFNISVHKSLVPFRG
ncbi:DUF2971 domain-containing protein [Aliivibrio fischeri]|uniref:DUF2971 domain-containing protein n=1 Tax=Aliivibrio fischeri TaxID=668 RepID=UPI001F1DE248|nr:DUF2971 domain-containing protein [Aliivibrio fischeri]MCE4937455.1 hypothetical protein [Aliivibrio fischeri]